MMSKLANTRRSCSQSHGPAVRSCSPSSTGATAPDLVARGEGSRATGTLRNMKVLQETSNDRVRRGTRCRSLSTRSPLSDLGSPLHPNHCRTRGASPRACGMAGSPPGWTSPHSACPSGLSQQLCRTSWLSVVGALLSLLQLSLCNNADPEWSIHPGRSSSPVFQQSLHSRQRVDPPDSNPGADRSTMDREG